MVSKTGQCSMCKKEMRSDNLKRHEKICKMRGKPNDKGMKVPDLGVKKRKLEHPILKEEADPIFEEDVKQVINKIIKDNPQSPHTHKQGEKKTVKNIKTYPVIELPIVPKPESIEVKIDQPSHFLPSDDAGLKENLCLLYAEYAAGNKESTRPQILSILKELYQRGVLNQAEYNGVCDVFESDSSSESESSPDSDTDSELSDSESDTDGADELDFDALVRSTIENLTRNERKNLITLSTVDTRPIVKKYLDGVEDIKSVMEKLSDFKDMRTKILLRSIEQIQGRVRKVLEALRNIDDTDVGTTLEHLRLNELISDKEFHRLLTSANNVLSYAKAIQGSGIWV